MSNWIHVGRYRVGNLGRIITLYNDIENVYRELYSSMYTYGVVFHMPTLIRYCEVERPISYYLPSPEEAVKESARIKTYIQKDDGDHMNGYISVYTDREDMIENIDTYFKEVIMKSSYPAILLNRIVRINIPDKIILRIGWEDVVLDVNENSRGKTLYAVCGSELINNSIIEGIDIEKTGYLKMFEAIERHMKNSLIGVLSREYGIRIYDRKLVDSIKLDERIYLYIMRKIKGEQNPIKLFIENAVGYNGNLDGGMLYRKNPYQEVDYPVYVTYRGRVEIDIYSMNMELMIDGEGKHRIWIMAYTGAEGKIRITIPEEAAENTALYRLSKCVMVGKHSPTYFKTGEEAIKSLEMDMMGVEVSRRGREIHIYIRDRDDVKWRKNIEAMEEM